MGKITMEDNFVLSEKILEKENRYYLDIAWVKEFIRRLKKEIPKGHTEIGFELIIDKLSGDKLK